VDKAADAGSQARRQPRVPAIGQAARRNIEDA
jgi:hypothetical protein